MIEWNVAKVVVVLLLAAAVVFLCVAFRNLMASKKGEDDQGKVFRALVKRVGFSIAALLFILIAGYSGWFE